MSIFDRIRRFPLTWLFLGALAVLVAVQLVALVCGTSRVGADIVAPLLAAVAGIGVYRLVMTRAAGRAVPELARRGAVRDTLAGLAVGTGVVLLAVAMLAVAGVYRFGAGDDPVFMTLVTALTVNVGVAVFEELLFRGLLFQAVEAFTGRWVAVAVTSVLFGAAHLLNDSSTVVGALGVAVEAGVLLGVAFVWRRSLWLVVGVHVGLNAVAQLLGLPAAEATPGLLTVHAEGPALLTGGKPGFGASAATVVVGVAAAVVLLTLATRDRAPAPGPR